MHTGIADRVYLRSCTMNALEEQRQEGSASASSSSGTDGAGRVNTCSTGGHWEDP